MNHSFQFSYLNQIFLDNYTRIFVTLTTTLYNYTYVFILYQTMQVVIGIIFRSVNDIGENICLATQKVLKML